MAAEDRYQKMKYRRAGRSGIVLPELSLGLWHNFGHSADPSVARSIAVRAFDLGITCFDLANNYGPPPGAAEERFGQILRSDLGAFRDELIITSKAGYDMWPGPHGDGGSRKYLLASLDQSLKRLGVDYVDVFYHHRWDPDTPIEETMGALDHAVRSGKALYAGVSNYGPEQMDQALEVLRSLGTPCLLNQPVYSMLNRQFEEGLLQLLEREGIGCAVYSPLAQGILTPRYLESIPEDSRAADPEGFLSVDAVTRRREMVRRLNQVALDRGQNLAQLALSWVLRHAAVTSAIIGVSRLEQLEDNVAALEAPILTSEECNAIDVILGSQNA